MKKILFKSTDISRLIKKLAGNIADAHEKSDELVLIGIHSRGVPLAKRISEKIKSIKKVKIELGMLDINLYRDDVHSLNAQPIVRETVVPFDLNDKEVVLVDDVLFTGRTVRAALDALSDVGRPKFVKLAVLIDRGGRELPIQPDFTGEKIQAHKSQNINVSLKEIDGKDQVVLEE